MTLAVGVMRWARFVAKLVDMKVESFASVEERDQAAGVAVEGTAAEATPQQKPPRAIQWSRQGRVQWRVLTGRTVLMEGPDGVGPRWRVPSRSARIRNNEEFRIMKMMMMMKYDT